MRVSFKIPNFSEKLWRELPENPLIGKELTERQAIGDPQVILPGEYDNQWHLFYHGFLFAPDGSWPPIFVHCVSPDGIHWSEKQRWNWPTGPHYMYCDGDRWIMYYTRMLHYTPGLTEKYGCHAIIRAKTTRDFINWSDDTDIILPETTAEREAKGYKRAILA